MKIETELIYKLVKKYGGVLTDDRHFMDDVEHLLERSDNSDYAKCSDEIEKMMMYRGEMPEQGQLIEILKKHFA